MNRPSRNLSFVFLASLVVTLGMASAPAQAASTFYLDQLSLTLNGNQIFVDDFNDGVQPPNSPAYAGSAVAPGYLVFGNYPAGSEAGGKLNMSVANGIPTQTANGLPAVGQFAILQTPINPAAPLSLNGNDTFKVAALYDYRNPDGPTEHFRLSVTDRVTPQGPGDTTKNVISLAVMRAGFGPGNGSQINPATGEPFGDLNGQVVVALYKQDFVANTLVFLEARPVDLTGNPDQIRLTLDKASSGSTAISASYTYVKNGSDLSTTQLTTPAVGFVDRAFTRPDVAAVQVTTAKTTAAAALTTGSPAGISQTVSSVTSDNLQFKYQFTTNSGQLKVTLNGVELGVFDAPSSPDGLFTTVNLDTSAFLGALDALLTFTLDGPTGSSILLDDIIFANLVNPDFQTGNLTGWSTFSSGAGSVGVALKVEETPLPGALLLFASGLGVMGAFGRRRRRMSPFTRAA